MSNSAPPKLGLGITVVAALLCLGGGHILRQRFEMGSASPLLQPGLSASTGTPEQESSKSYYDLVQLLEKQYVDSITDEKELANGAIKGMVQGLDDLDCQFFEAEDIKFQQKVWAGDWEGIGVQISFEQPLRPAGKIKDEDRVLLIPSVVIADVAEDSSASKAGLKPGDKIVQIDDSWLVGGEEIKVIRDRDAANSKDPAFRTATEKLRDALRTKLEKSMAPMSAKKALERGASGTVKLVYSRNGMTLKASVNRGSWKANSLAPQQDGSYKLRVLSSVEKELASLQSDKPLTLDLRNGFRGDPASIEATLQFFSGTKGINTVERSKSDSVAKEIELGSSDKQLKLIVDKNTSGTNLLIARALFGKPGVTIQGELRAEPGKWTKLFEAEEGAAYVLVTGLIKAGLK